MKFTFAYIYYRVCKAFFKWDGSEGNRAIWAVTMIQTLIIFDLIIMLLTLFWGHTSLFPYSKILGMSAVVVLFILMIVNGRKYDGRYDELDARWKDESQRKKLLKGCVVTLAMVLPWVGLFLISRLK
jgi:uncharacterized membrane-anchored protein